MFTRSHIEFAKRIFYDRLGDAYVYGGTWNPFDVHAGCDCSGEVTDELGAAFFGTDMHWDREGLSTESYRYKPPGPQQVGPFNLVHVTDPAQVPADAPLKIGIHHEGEGGPQSHMWCEVDGVRMETNGTLGTCIGRAYNDAYANDWWYAPGPIQEDGTPLTQAPEPKDTIFADVSEFQHPVDDSYPYQVLSIRANDGTHRDAHFATNYAWCVNAVASGKLTFFIVYFYWRPGSGDVDTLMSMVSAAGGPHPNMVVMMDVESGGNPGGDESPELNAEYNRLAQWLGDPRRVIAYANLGDARSMWHNHPDEGWILAGYGANPSDPLYRKLAHQYTDGNGYGGGLAEGAPPFGNCDMNSADGLTPSAFAAICGINTASQPLGGFLMALTDAQQQQIYDRLMADDAKVTGVWASRSPLRRLGEGLVDDTVGMELNMDGNLHVVVVILLAFVGDPATLELLNELADADLTKYPDRADGKALAARILAKVQTAPTAAVSNINVQTPAPAALAAPVATETAAAPAAAAGSGHIDVAAWLAGIEQIIKGDK